MLFRSFGKNRGWDKVVVDLLTAEGHYEENGATNFLLSHLNEGAVPATAISARLFLGVQVQCTQCHNHPFNKGKQNQFWEFNAFFRQARALRRFEQTMDIQSIELVDEDFPGEGGDPQAAEIYYELRNGLKQVAFPVFIDGTAISKSGYLPAKLADGTPYGAHRRRELARLIEASPLMPKVIVNRIWAHFLGYG